jgi:CyaY protein
MTETEFLDRVAKIWRQIESQVDDWVEQADVDIESLRQGPVIELEFESGRKIVVNAQAPMQQVWLASPRGAFHFQWNDTAWADTRTGTDFWAVLHQEASQEAGVSLPPSR